MEWDTIIIWIRLAAAIIVFVSSCLGLGYLAGLWVQRRGWPGWVSGLMSLALAILWPALIVGYVIYDARRYHALHPHDDAPGMVVMSVISVGAPLLFLFSLPLIFVGASMARRKGPR
jgi:hypothetical protein